MTEKQTTEPGPDPEFPEWHPNLSGPHYQPTGGPNGTSFSIAIGRPGAPPPTDDEENLFRLYEKEIANACQMIIPDEDEKPEDGRPHRDPVGDSKFPRKLGATATGWEVWLDESTRSL